MRPASDCHTPQVLDELVIRKTGRLPRPEGPPGDGAAATRQLDAALTTVGYKLSREALTALSAHTPEMVTRIGQALTDVVGRLVGNHVQHNVYFRDFPANVPDTMRFWAECVRDALRDPDARDTVRRDLSAGTLDLLTLRRYGRYRHRYEELVAAHDELIPLLSDRMTVIELGEPLADAARALYVELAGRTTPPSADDLAALAELAPACDADTRPHPIPMRETRAVVNAVRLARGDDIVVDTVTDVLRLACAMSDGDVTLTEPTKFRSFRRPERRALLAALDPIVAADDAKLGDVAAHREPWKRLGERLHPHEFRRFPHAVEVFAVARGERRVPSLAARIEAAYARRDLSAALAVYRIAPGTMLRAVDRLLRATDTAAELDLVVTAVTEVLGEVSGRLLLSVREHLENRAGDAGTARRIFVNRQARAWASFDDRAPLPEAAVRRLADALDAEITRRLPAVEHLVVDEDLLDIALPLSSKTMPAGMGLRPRGSVSRVDGQLLRFFVYWRQTRETTDFDLSALLLDDRFENPDWLSYTSLKTVGGVHSGDIVEAPDGASEFIDLDLRALGRDVVVPQVNIYSGENFDVVAESFFGFMLRESEQAGLPFEPRTVRMKSDLRGTGRVALPLAFVRDDTGTWRAHWLHLFLTGNPAFNQVENNRVSTTELVRGVLDRTYLTVRYLIDRLDPAEVTVLEHGAARPAGPHLYLGADSLGVLPDLVPE